ncbi:MAG: helix-turn-helix domain-containing protein [Micromonosporaceae bacterium]
MQRVRDGRTQLDRAGACDHSGAAASTVAYWYRHRTQTGFPDVADTDPDGRQWWWADGIAPFTATHHAARAAAYTPVDRSGDPDELLTAPQAARVLGYRDHRSLPANLRANPDDVTELPSGRLRRRWHRRTLWAYADNRAQHRSPGPPPGTPSTQRKPHPYADDPRLDQIRELLNAGVRTAEIAARIGVSRRTASRLIKAAKNSSTQATASR